MRRRSFPPFEGDADRKKSVLATPGCLAVRDDTNLTNRFPPGNQEMHTRQCVEHAPGATDGRFQPPDGLLRPHLGGERLHHYG